MRNLDESSYSICYDATTYGALDRVAYSDRGIVSPGSHSSRFALNLLRENVLLLCIDCGMNPHDLWPPEALLLNLYTFQRFIEIQLRSKSIGTELFEDNTEANKAGSSVSSESFAFYKQMPDIRSIASTMSVVESHIERYEIINAVRKAIDQSSSNSIRT